VRKPIAAVLLLAGAVTFLGCTREDATAQTATMEPASPQGRGTTTDAVTTQTVDLGDAERSPNEGAGIGNEPETTTTTTTGTTPNPPP
jgi:hypothetical protein